jgi:hypothetical protein
MMKIVAVFRAEIRHAAWFSSTVEAVAAAVALTTMRAAALTLVTTCVRQRRGGRAFGHPNHGTWLHCEELCGNPYGDEG